ncbi:MAG: spore germination protein GerW family protein [Gammaproteobacteria bacterium]|nr:spore germination protein GerW family protein [Gammaproteobacteria bacterium]MDH3449282.1 spore germination protein GerW family protein [Gammaproteobacteria bacterium]
MEDISILFDKAVAEIERMLNSKTVVGEPITVEGNTLIPLVNVGFGFGVGGGQGTEPNKGSGQGGGTGGGGGVKPVALVIINAAGVRVEPIKSGTASVLEKVAESIGKVVGKKGESDSD